MTTFVKIDGIWINPEHVVTVAPSHSPERALSKVLTIAGQYVLVAGTPDEVIKELCK